MKKALLLAAATITGMAAYAQKVNVQNAQNYLKDKDYKSALQYINMATEDPSTKDEAKTWFVRANIYIAMQQDPAFKADNPYREAQKSYMKMIQIKSSNEKETVDQNLLYTAQMYLNDAIGAYNDKKYDDSYEWSLKMVEVHDLEGGKRFTNKQFDTISVQAKAIAAYSAYYNHKYEQALPLLIDLKGSAIGREVIVYNMLEDIYASQQKYDDQIATIEEGRKQYPENINLRNDELNYYIKTGKQDVFMKKLEDAVAKDPKNSDLNFNLANGYSQTAFPKDAAGKELPAPANYADLVAKAKTAYSATLASAPDNAEYNFYTGVLYYNEASNMTKTMNALGNSKEELKKYEDMKVARDGIFGQAVPYFEKTVSKLDPKLGSFTPDEKFQYQSALAALKEIYARQENTQKSEEMKKKLEASRQK